MIYQSNAFVMSNGICVLTYHEYTLPRKAAILLYGIL